MVIAESFERHFLVRGTGGEEAEKIEWRRRAQLAFEFSQKCSGADYWSAPALSHSRPGSSPNRSSPDVASVLGNHRLAGLAAPRFLELGHVLHHAVDAELSGRVGIGQHQNARDLRTPLLAPNAGEP